MRLLSRLPLAGTLSAILALSACVDLAPTYQRPDAPVAAESASASRCWPAWCSTASTSGSR